MVPATSSHIRFSGTSWTTSIMTFVSELQSVRRGSDSGADHLRSNYNPSKWLLLR